MPPATLISTRAEILPLFRLALPLMVGLGAALLIGVVDTVMIAPLGTVALAAAGITTAVLIVLISALWGLIAVVGIQIAQATGADSAPRVAAALRSGLVLALVCGVGGGLIMLAVFPLLGPIGQPPEVLEILFPYWASMALWILPFTIFFVLKSLFDATGKAWAGVAFSYLGVVVNVPANYLLIHVAGLGLLGAGLASILSQCASLAVGWIYLRRASAMAPYRVAVPIPQGAVLRQLRDGLPLCLGYAGEGGAYAMVGLMIGWLGATALAAHQVVNALASVAYIIPLGMAGAVSIRVGMAVGGGQTDRLRPILKAGFLVVTFWQLAAAAIFIFAGRSLAASLSDDPAVVALAATLFIAVAALQVADGIQATALGALRGMLDVVVPSIITLAAYWPFALPLAYLVGFPLGYGAPGIWVGYTLGLIVAAILLPIRFWRKTAPH